VPPPGLLYWASVVGGRTRITLCVGVLALLLPVQAQAASGRVRVLNAGTSGTVSLLVDGQRTAITATAGGVSKRFAVTARLHTFAIARGPRTVADRTISVRSGQRLTIVLTVTGGRSVVRLLREPHGVSGATLVRVANYASRAGPVDIRVGALTIAKALAVGNASAADQVTSDLSPTGTIRVSARRTTSGATFSASGKLILATRSVGLYALVPTASSARLIRLPYDITPPTPKRLPAITGTRRFNHTVTCGRGSWTPRTPRLSRRWTVDGVAHGGGATLRLTTAADAGHVLACTVSATSHGMTTRFRTRFVLPSVPRPIVPPAIVVPDGALQVGDIASCDVGKWAGGATAFAFRWIRVRDHQVLGTQSTYAMRLTDNGLNNVVACLVSATNDGGPSRPAESLNTIALDIPPTISIRSGPRRPTEDATTFGFFTFAIGGGGADAVTGTFDGAPVTCDRAGCQVDFLFNDGPGAVPHTFTATATNAAGSATTPAWAWSVNPLPPFITQPMGTSSHTANPATFTWNGTGGGKAGSVECSLDRGATFFACTGPDPTTAVVGFGQDPPPEGIPERVQIRSRNAAGVSPTIEIFPWQFNPAPATITSVDVDPVSNSSARPFRPVVGLTGGAVNLTCLIDAPNPLTNLAGAVLCGPLDPPLPAITGSHTLTVIASNASGTFIAQPFPFTYN